MKKLFLFTLICSLGFFTACSDDDDNDTPTPTLQRSIWLKKSKGYTMLTYF